MKNQNPKLNPKLLTPSEAAAILRVTRRTIYTWLRTGKLKAKRVGGIWRIDERNVTRY